MKIDRAAQEFLATQRIAVTGVSRTPENHGSNIVYRRLRERGYDVFAVNPHAETVEGDTCYPTLSDIPDGVEAVVIGTRPAHAEATVRECLDLGVMHVWMHRAFGGGSVDEAAAELGRANGITVIDGGCPCMFAPTSDGGHRVIKAVCSLTGAVPRRIDDPRPLRTG